MQLAPTPLCSRSRDILVYYALYTYMYILSLISIVQGEGEGEAGGATYISNPTTSLSGLYSSDSPPEVASRRSCSQWI